MPADRQRGVRVRAETVRQENVHVHGVRPERDRLGDAVVRRLGVVVVRVNLDHGSGPGL